MRTAARLKKGEDRVQESTVTEVARNTLQAKIEAALKEAEIVHSEVIRDIEGQKLSEACIKEAVEHEKANWQKFYASFVVRRLTTSVITGLASSTSAPGW